MESVEPELYLSASLHRSQPGALSELSRGIPGCGAWIRSREYLDSDRLRVVIEFPRELSPDVYGALVGAGLELSQDSHLLLTDLCRCAPYFRQGSELARTETAVFQTPDAAKDDDRVETEEPASETADHERGNPAAVRTARKPVIRVQLQIALGAADLGRSPFLNAELNPI
jgi:hypothetical protein